MKIVAVSDTHNQLHKVKVPACDLLIHAGDLTMHGTEKELRQEAKELASKDAKKKVIIAGNHDWICQREPLKAHEIFKKNGIIYLLDASVEISGIKIYGSPWQPWFYDWAFNLRRGQPLKDKWKLIPKDTDILVTHGPPLGYLDTVQRMSDVMWPSDSCIGKESVGCRDLLDAVLRIEPSYHIFGHIHPQYGVKKTATTTYINAATCDSHYLTTHKPVVFNYERHS